MVSRDLAVATGPGVSGDYFMGGGEMYSHKRNAGASGDRPDGEMGVRKAEEAEMDNGQWTMDNWGITDSSTRLRLAQNDMQNGESPQILSVVLSKRSAPKDPFPCDFHTQHRIPS